MRFPAVHRENLRTHLQAHVNELQRNLRDLGSKPYPYSPVLQDAKRDSALIIPSVIGHEIGTTVTLANHFGIYIELNQVVERRWKCAHCGEVVDKQPAICPGCDAGDPTSVVRKVWTEVIA